MQFCVFNTLATGHVVRPFPVPSPLLLTDIQIQVAEIVQLALNKPAFCRSDLHNSSLKRNHLGNY